MILLRIALLLACLPAWAQVAPPLGTNGSFAVVASTFTNGPNVAAQTAIGGDVCFTTGPTTPPMSISGTTFTPCPPQNGLDQATAIGILLGQPCTVLGAGAVALDAVIIGTNPPGTIPPGCYSSGGAMSITVGTTVTLTGNGIYVFRPGGALTTGANSLVSLAAGACAANVYWAPVGAATLGANAAATVAPTFVGNILSAAGITIGQFANFSGRALAFGGTVTTAAVTITVPAACAPPPGAGSVVIPTLTEWMLILLAVLLASSALFTIRRA